MKRTTSILIFVLFLLVAGYFVYVQTRPAEDNVFHVENPEQIHLIRLTQVIKGETTGKLELNRAGDAWQVEGEYPIVEKKIVNFLNVLGAIRVREKIEDAGMESALSILKKNHILVELYDQEREEILSYLIGATDSRHTSNIMMVKGASQAYLVARPGMEGYVSVMYQTDPLLWREKELWDIQGKELTEFRVDYADESAAGYHLSKQADGNWVLIGADQSAEMGRVEEYLRLFNGPVNGEKFVGASYPGMRDSLGTRIPDVSIGFATSTGEQGNLHMFVRPENANNYFGYLEGKPELYTVQHFVIDKFLKTRGYFQAQIQ